MDGDEDSPLETVFDRPGRHAGGEELVAGHHAVLGGGETGDGQVGVHGHQRSSGV
jgi:hypothetical protein